MILSVDVEDYFQVEAFTGVVSRADWNSYEPRVEGNTRLLLDLFDEYRVRGTFFILGWVADRHPRLIREIAERGHETACHSYWHRLIYTLAPSEFREDTRQAKHAIENAAGRAVRGYRAPSYSITAESLWALSILAEEGFEYDSSIFPVQHDIYGIPKASRRPYRADTPGGPIMEFPLTTFRLLGSTNLPVGGGGYLRILPFWYTRSGIALAQAESIPLIAYIHPWELDPNQPRISAGFKSRLRHYTNLRHTQAKLRKLIGMGNFTSFESVISETANQVLPLGADLDKTAASSAAGV